jgi:molecular chaperone GrpE (heat shock protein)
MTLHIKNQFLNNLLVRIQRHLKRHLSKWIVYDEPINIPNNVEKILVDNALRLHDTLKNNTTRLASVLLNNEKNLNSVVESNISTIQTILLSSKNKPNDSVNDLDEFKSTVLNSIKQFSDVIHDDIQSIKAVWTSSNQAQSAAKCVDSVNLAVTKLEDNISDLLTQHVQDLIDSQAWYADQSTNTINQTLVAIDEKINNNTRRDRRSIQTMEYMVSCQEEIKKLLQVDADQNAKNEVMDFADNFILLLLTLPNDQNITILTKKFDLLLRQYGLSIIAELDVPFDPEIHTACDSLRNLSKDENTVLRIISPGYYEDGQLLRPATVVINRWTATNEDNGPG